MLTCYELWIQVKYYSSTIKQILFITFLLLGWSSAVVKKVYSVYTLDFFIIFQQVKFICKNKSWIGEAAQWSLIPQLNTI